MKPMCLVALVLSGCLEARSGRVIDASDTTDVSDVTPVADVPDVDTTAPDLQTCAPLAGAPATVVAIECSDWYGGDDQPEDVLIFEGTSLWGMVFDAGNNASNDWQVVSYDLNASVPGAWKEYNPPSSYFARWKIVDARDGVGLVAGTGKNGEHIVALVSHSFEDGQILLRTAQGTSSVALPFDGRTPRAIDGDVVAWAEQWFDDTILKSKVYVHDLRTGDTTLTAEVDGTIAAPSVAAGRAAWVEGPLAGRNQAVLWRRGGEVTRIDLDTDAFDVALTRRHLYVRTVDAVVVVDVASERIVTRHALYCAGLTSDGERVMASCGPSSTWPFTDPSNAYLFDGAEARALPRATSVSAVTAPALEGRYAAWIEVEADAGCRGTQDVGTVVVADLSTFEVSSLATTRIPCLCCGRDWPVPAVRVNSQAVAWRYGAPVDPNESDPAEPWVNPHYTYVGYAFFGVCAP